MARTISIAAGTLAFALAGPALGAEPDGAGSRVLLSFSQCRAITDPTQRLDCFDKAAGALEQAVKANDVRIVDRGDIRKARRSLFGFTLPRIGLFGRDDDDKEPPFSEINTTVASSRQIANGRVEIRLADDSGAVWQTTESLTFPPKTGAKVRIRQATLGSYFMQIDGKSVRGMRVR